MSFAKQHSPSEYDERDRQFIRLYLDHMRRLYSYIFAFVPNRFDADDIFQEVTFVMWRKYESFATEIGFFNWAVKIARNKIKQHIQEKSRESVGKHLIALQSLEDTTLAMLKEPSFKQEALRHCMSRLKEKDLELLHLRYEDDASTQTVAARLGRSVSAIYKALNRIHYQLLLCIQQKLAWEKQR